MLEEIIATFFSLFSSLTLDTPRISHQMSADNGSSEQAIWVTWQDKIHREYSLSEEESRPSTIEYVQLGYERQIKRTYAQSFLRSLKVTFWMTVALLPLFITGLTIIYFDLRTCDLCSQWRSKNYTLSFDVMKIRLIGNGVEIMILNLWFPMTLMVLFGINEFKLHYSSTVLVALISGLLYTLYSSFLLLYDVYDTSSWYRVPGNVTYAVAVLWECVIVVRKIRQNYPTVTYTYRHILTVISVPFLCSYAVTMFYRYAVVFWFNSLHNVVYKFIIAISTPTITIIPIAICRHIALWRSSQVTEAERSFVLVYYMRAGWICLYRIMQADFKSIWLFIGISVLSGVSSMLRKATIGFRQRVWAQIIRYLNQSCCPRLRHLPENTPHHRRLNADIEIQNTLFENDAILLGQAYIVLYMITSFELSQWSIIRESLIRIAIGLGIEFLFSFLSIFILIHWHDIPIARVWSKYWKRHLFANGVIVMLLCYFTKALVSVLKNRVHDENFTMRNCTLPNQSWL